jgi:hypothetical protein
MKRQSIFILAIIAVIFSYSFVFAGDILPDNPLKITAYTTHVTHDKIYIYNPNDHSVNLADYEVSISINGEIDHGLQFYHDKLGDEIASHSYIVYTLPDYATEGYTRPHELCLYDNLHDMESGHCIFYNELSHDSPFIYTVFIATVNK